MRTINIGIAGMGKIARDQHVSAIRSNPSFKLVAVASPHAKLEGTPHFSDIATLLKQTPDVVAISICTPPQVRFDVAMSALLHGKHVMLEKPPGVTVSEVAALVETAASKQLSLFATWHSREAAAVKQAQQWLASRVIHQVNINWKEDVRVWHPGQEWIWQPGGLGVFDPGINALSVLTRILPHAVRLKDAELFIPVNRATPIAATLKMESQNALINAEFDFRQTGPASWDIEVQTNDGVLKLVNGGALMFLNNTAVISAQNQEYPNLYVRFAELIAQRAIDVDITPLQLVADALLCGRHVATEPFEW